jgi:hypothetical protein
MYNELLEGAKTVRVEGGGTDGFGVVKVLRRD